MAECPAMLTESNACPSCSASVPAGARFCPQCGASLGAAPATAAPAAPAAARRQVAILFADLSGYTALSSELDPEDVHRLLSRYFELVDALIGECGGTIDKHIGDAVMGVFGAPVAYGNDTLRALRAAVGIHAAMETLSSEFGRPLFAHVGVASGEVVAADTGSAVHRSYTVTGDAVNLAARLDELARAGETIIADDVYQPHAHLVDAEPQGSVPIRGLDHELRVWKLRGLRGPAVSATPLIGRAGEVTRFAAILERAAQDRSGTTVLVCADPGMGKSRLTEEFLAVATRQGQAGHAAVVLDFGAAQGRDAVHGVYCSLLGIPADANAPARRAALDQDIAAGRIDEDDEPFVADLLAVPPRLQTRYEAMDNATRTQGKLRLLVAAVEAATATTPCVLVIEDLHWASPWVLACADAWSRCAKRLPCTLVLTSRREGDPITPAWPAERIARFDLAPLAAGDALQLAQTYLETNPDVALRCVERAQGNPLFLTQLLQSGADGAAIPGTIQSVVMARLDRLPAADKAALQAAAVIGQRFGLDMLRHLLADASFAATNLVARDLVRQESEGGARMMFVHALIRDGAYASLLHSARRALHLRAADWYAERDATLRAEHLDRAGDPRAAEAYLAAARGEAASLRFDDALRLLRRGAKLDAPSAVRHKLEMLEGELCGDLGDAPGAIAAFERSLPLAADDRERCAAWMGIAAGYRVTSTLPPAFAALDHAQELAERNSLDRERACVHYQRGNLHFAAGKGDACRAEHERALQFAQRAGYAECEAQAYSGLGDAYYAQGRMRSAHDAFTRCVAICEREGLTRFAIMNNAMIAIIEAWLGDSDAALARLARVGADARELRHRLAETMNSQVTGWVLVLRGRYEQAVPHIERSLALAREIGARRYESLDLMLLARTHASRGEFDDARARLDAAWQLSTQTGHGFAGAIVQGALALVAAGDDERRAALTTGEALLREHAVAHGHFWFYRDAIGASLEANDWSEAERYADALADFTREEPLPWSDLQVEIGRSLAAAGRGHGDREALLACRERAAALQCDGQVVVLDAVVAQLGMT